MRKVLLATTALVAMSVTAAQADIAINWWVWPRIHDVSKHRNYYFSWC
jgi:hypothetical protein